MVSLIAGCCEIVTLLPGLVKSALEKAVLIPELALFYFEIEKTTGSILLFILRNREENLFEIEKLLFSSAYLPGSGHDQMQSNKRIGCFQQNVYFTRIIDNIPQ